MYYEEKDGYYRDTSHGEDESQLENAGGRMRFLWQPNDDFSAMLGYEQHKLKTDGAGRAVLGPYGDYYDSIVQYDPSVVLHEDNDLSDRKTQDGVYLHRERDFYLGSLRMDWTINSSWDLTSLTGYQDWKSTMDSSRSAANIGFNSSIGPGPYWLNPGFSIEKSKQLSEELRFAYSSDKLSSIIGLYYSDSDTNGSDTDVARTSRVFPATDGGPGAQLISVALDTAGTGSSEEWAIFSHNIYSLTDRWDITLGLRYTSVEVTGDGHTRWGGEYTYLQSPIIPITPSSWEVPTNRKTFDEVTGALKASYQASEEISLYASYNRGFKPGGFGTSDQDFDDFSGTIYTPATAYDSETSDAFELGMKSLMLDHTFSLNIAAFYQVYDDYQVQSIDPVTLQAVISNAKEVIVQGGDIGYEWLATPNLTFDGNAAYIDSTYDDFKDSVCARPQWAAIACADGGKQDLSGERLNQVSPWSATLNATWHDTLDNGMGWYLRGEYVYRGNRYLMEDLDPGAHDGQYQLLNASLGLSAVDERWTAILWAKNITNATYMVAAGTNADGETYAGLQVVANEPRTFGATLRYQF